jgi:hypothetical protein
VLRQEIHGLQQAGADIVIRTLDAAQLWQLHLQERLGVFTHAYGYYEGLRQCQQELHHVAKETCYVLYNERDLLCPI